MKKKKSPCRALEALKLCFYLVVVDQVKNQVYVSVHGLVLGQLRLHSVEPVNESLERICKLSGEEQGFLQLVLSAGDHES